MPYKDRDDYNNRRRRWRLERRIEKLPVRLPLMRTIKVQFRPAQLAVLNIPAGGLTPLRRPRGEPAPTSDPHQELRAAVRAYLADVARTSIGLQTSWKSYEALKEALDG